MGRLIDADEAIDYVNALITVHRYYHPRSTTENFPISEVIARINEVPTVEATPVKHGHWIERTDYVGDTYYDCSACGESWTTIEGDPWDNGMDYCPQCGAKMDEVTE